MRCIVIMRNKEYEIYLDSLKDFKFYFRPRTKIFLADIYEKWKKTKY